MKEELTLVTDDKSLLNDIKRELDLLKNHLNDYNFAENNLPSGFFLVLAFSAIRFIGHFGYALHRSFCLPFRVSCFPPRPRQPIFSQSATNSPVQTNPARKTNLRPMSLPTATTPRVGMPYLVPASAVRASSSRERDSPAAPMKVWTAIQSAFSRITLSVAGRSRRHWTYHRKGRWSHRSLGHICPPEQSGRYRSG